MTSANTLWSLWRVSIPLTVPVWVKRRIKWASPFTSVILRVALVTSGWLMFISVTAQVRVAAGHHPGAALHWCFSPLIPEQIMVVDWWQERLPESHLSGPFWVWGRWHPYSLGRTGWMLPQIRCSWRPPGSRQLIPFSSALGYQVEVLMFLALEGCLHPSFPWNSDLCHVVRSQVGLWQRYPLSGSLFHLLNALNLVFWMP